MKDYGIDIWGSDNYFIKNGKICINFGKNPALIDIDRKSVGRERV